MCGIKKKKNKNPSGSPLWEERNVSKFGVSLD